MYFFLALSLVASAAATSLGDLLNLTCAASTCSLWASSLGDSQAVAVPLRLSFYAPSIVRWWLAVDGNFSDTGAASDVIVGGGAPVTAVSHDAGSYIEISQASRPSPDVVLRINKSPVQLSILVSGNIVVQEVAPLTWNQSSSWQTLARDAAPFPAGLTVEHFFGGGMQNGRFAHRDEAITIAVDYNWEDGGHPNSVPWYLSTAGYGVLRNTWAPGVYSFVSPVVTSHDEGNRFDAFFTLAAPGDIKALLGLYTNLTGPPFMPPIYALFLGDSDCYHNDRHGNSTQVAIAIAQLYEDNDMPRGWMLPNDGYGCGYGESNDGAFPSNLTDLTYVVAKLHELGLYTGLWTSTGMPNIVAEVGIAGTRVCKTDVGWIGAGYKYAFDGVSLCAGGIENNSHPPARRFIWTVEGWAGTHRLAVMWTGDDSGDMDYVRWQIPTFTGSGFTAQAHVSGDIDGIFGGSPESQVRDFQMKAFGSVLMVMSGWAPNPDKQPWTWGEPYTSFNRASLKLKAQLTPYMYSLSRVAYDTGVPPVRAMLLEFPEDETLYVPTNGTSYSFMSGPSILVVPVFIEGAVTRDGIYLPNGSDWADWTTGLIYGGGQTLNGYDAPLSSIPVFARAGAIIPMWPPMNYFNEKPHDPMFLELWPAGNSTFVLYEDDGVTRDALEAGAFSSTPISVHAPSNYLNASTAGNVTIVVGATAGTFDGQLTSRGWRANVRSRSAPLEVVLAVDGSAPTVLPEMQSESELEYSSQGWFYDNSLEKGLLMVKTAKIAAVTGFTVTLSNGPSYPRIGTETCDTPAHHQVENQKFSFDGASGKITVVDGASPPNCVTVGKNLDPDSHTPAVEVQPCSAAADAQQQFAFVAASGQIALKADSGSCLDQDVSDSRVIQYSCHDQKSPGNQAWSLDATTQHVVSLENGLCMAVFGST